MIEKPPVLGDEEIIITVCGDCPFEDKYSDEDCHACQRNFKVIAQAQRDSDAEYYEDKIKALQQLKNQDNVV